VQPRKEAIVTSTRARVRRLAALLVIAAGAAYAQTAQDARAALGGTSWRLVRFQGGDDSVLTPDDRSKYTIQFDAGGGLTARLDCNRGRGTWTSSGPSQLQLGPLALTRAMCPPGSLHDQIVKQWAYVRSYILKDGRLFLSLMADGGIYEFEPIVGHETGATMGATSTQGTVPAVEGSLWRLVQVRGQTNQAVASLQRPPTLRLNGGQAAAFGGCNRFTGAYTLAGERITFGNFAGTMMACPPPVMTIEAAFAKALTGALRAAVVGDRLTLSQDASADPALVFVAEPPPVIEGAWEVTALDNGRQGLASPVAGTSLSVTFKDGAVVGSAGCNTFRGRYTRDGTQIAIGPVAATRKTCEASGVMEQEGRLLSALQSATAWSIESDTLELRRADGARLVTARRTAK
jgi:heat shock protein HslJ